MEPVLKYRKVPKNYDLGCLKVCFVPSTLPMVILISEKSTHLTQKVYSYQRTTKNQS